jgi:hypothetical protein
MTVAVKLTNEQIVHNFKLAAVKARSNLQEALLGEEADDSVFVALGLNPWLFGPRCILPAVEKLEERGNPTDTEVMNLLRVAQMEPAIGVSWYHLPTLEDFMASRGAGGGWRA